MNRRRQIVTLFALLTVVSFAVITVLALTRSPSSDTLTADDVGNWTALRLLRESLDPTALNSTLLFYVHVPKTGGQSFSQLLRTCAVAKADLVQLRHSAGMRRHLGLSVNDSDSAFDLEVAKRSSLGVAQRVDTDFAQVPALVDQFRDGDYLKRMFRDKRFGLGHCDTSIAARLDAARRTVFITLLREPVARVRSMYYFLMTRLYSRTRSLRAFVAFVDELNGVGAAPLADNDGGAAPADEHDAADAGQASATPLNATSAWWTTIARITFNMTGPASLAQFAALVRQSSQDNYQTRALSGNLAMSFGKNSAARAVDAEMLRVAKATLRAMPFFGLTEFYNASVVLFEESIGTIFTCQRPAMRRRNTTPPFRSRTQLRALDEQIAQMERYDQQLYAFARRLFVYRCERSANCRALMIDQ